MGSDIGLYIPEVASHSAQLAVITIPGHLLQRLFHHRANKLSYPTLGRNEPLPDLDLLGFSLVEGILQRYKVWCSATE